MSLNVVQCHRNKEILVEGEANRMLFVRIDGTQKTMVKIPLLVIGVIIVVTIMPIHPSFSSSHPRDLDLIIYPDGSTHVSTEIAIDPLATDYELDLFGNNIDNFVVVGENEFLLTSEIIGGSAFIELLGHLLLLLNMTFMI